MARRNPRTNTSVKYANVGDWAKAASDLFTEMQDNTSGWFSTQAQSIYTKRLNDLYDQKDNWYSRFNGNQEATDAINAIVEDLQKARDAVEQNGKYYSQWKTKEEYDQWYSFYGADKDTRIKNATANLQTKTQEKDKAYKRYNDNYNTGIEDYDFFADNTGDEVDLEELWDAFIQAQKAEKAAREILWSAKYDSMTAAELQAVMKGLGDKEEKGFVSQLQRNANLAERKQELADLNAVIDPESVLFDPDFETKSAYQSTKLDEGVLGESNTEYGDIDYEFINGNKDISELIVGMDRNYYYINDQEKKIYNYWHAYDREHGTNKAKRYLNLLQETFNARDSEVDYGKIEGNTLLEILYGAKSGLTKFGRAIDTLVRQPEEYIPKTSTEMTAEKAYEGLEDALVVKWYNMKTGQWEDKIAGKSVGQHLFDTTEEIGYSAPANLTKGVVSMVNPYAGVALGSLIESAADAGDGYTNIIRRGYTQGQASEYANRIGVSNFIADELGGSIYGKIGNIFTENMSLGKFLSDTDLFGITDRLKLVAEEHSYKAVTGDEKPDEEELEKAVRSEVTAKAMDKIFNRMGADPENISADLRKPILQSLQDPAIRQLIEQKGRFSPERLDKITAGLINAGDRDEGIGTYVGDILYGPTGFAMNKRELIPLAEEAFRNRGMYADHPNARALYLRYKR